MTIYIDFETRSKADIKKVGAWRYAEDPSTEILCMAYAINEAPVQIWKPGIVTIPTWVVYLNVGLNKRNKVEAHNAFFERAIWENICVKRLGWPRIPHNRWRCSAAKAAYYALPRSLKNAGAALKLDTVKDEEGHQVMMNLCKPRKPSKSNPDEWFTKEKYPKRYEKLYEYCKQDVGAERAIAKSLPDIPEKETQIWLLDQKINQRGVYIDKEAVEASLSLLGTHITILKGKCHEICELSPNQRDKVISWCRDQGEDITAYDKEYIKNTLPQIKNEKVKEVLQIRQELGKTSTAKYTKMLGAICEDGRIRDTLMYHGAATGRWSGKLVQFQNLPRGSIDNMDSLIADIKNKRLKSGEYGLMDKMSAAIRGMITAPEGKQLVVADFASIEVRVLTWLAGCDTALEQLREGEDLYKYMASKIYSLPVAAISKEQRQLGKAAVLGCGYQMGAEKFHNTCLSWGINIPMETAEKAVSTYRTTYNEVKSLWYDQEDAAQRAVRSGKPIKAGKVIWFMNKDFLHCKLPSGRCISYKEPQLVLSATPWGSEQYKLRYMGEKSLSTAGKKWMTIDTYGGKLVENITQAVARDLMAEAMLRIDDKYPIVLSIHDELISEVDEDKVDVGEYEKLMAEVPDWARGCPIAVEGWSGKHYRK